MSGYARSAVGLMGMTACISFLGAPSARASIDIGPITNPGNSHTYYVLSSQDFSPAEAEAVSLGGHLATVSNSAEQSWLFSTFGTVRWIGINDRASEGTFVWVSGEPVTYTSWDSGQPQANNPGENCAAIYTGSGGNWHDVGCTGTYIVELNFLISDCDSNGIHDPIQIANSGALDCDSNQVPDDCQADLDNDGFIDECELCDEDPGKTAPGQCGCGIADDDSDTDSIADCNDVCPDFDDTIDCNGSGTPDACDISGGGSSDCDGNGVPDDCQLDDDGDTVPNVCDICPGSNDLADADGDGAPDCNDVCPGFDDNIDCNTNGVPDGCDIRDGGSEDCDESGIPDECESLPPAFDWIGADGGSFANPANWSPAGIPCGEAAATLENTAAIDNRCILSTPGERALRELTLSATGAGRQVLRIDGDSTLRTADGVNIQPGGEIDLRGGELSGGPVSNASNTISGYGVISADVDNAGLIAVTQLKDMDLTGDNFDNQGGGTLRAGAASRVAITSGSVSQAGDIEIRSNGTVGFDEPLVNDAGGLVSLLGGTLASDGFENADDADVTGFGTIDTDTTNNGMMQTLADTQVVGDLTNNGTVLNLTGALTVIGNLVNNGTIIGQSGGRGAGPSFAVAGDVRFGDASAFSLIDGVLRVSGGLDVASVDASAWDVRTATIQLNASGGVQELETLAEDMGRHVTLTDRALFSVGRLRVGPAATTVRLVNRHGIGQGALYVEHLVLEPGVTLDLAGQRLYYGRLTPSVAAPTEPGPDGVVLPGNVRVRDSVGGGVLCAIGGVRGDGDLNGDCATTADDVAAFAAVLVGLDQEPTRILAADVNADGRTNGADIAIFVVRLAR